MSDVFVMLLGRAAGRPRARRAVLEATFVCLGIAKAVNVLTAPFRRRSGWVLYR